jgi:hypothetical protein
MVDTKPKEAKGGTFAPADVKIIKDALMFFIDVANDLTTEEQRHISNLLHRLNRIG